MPDGRKKTIATERRPAVVSSRSRVTLQYAAASLIVVAAWTDGADAQSSERSEQDRQMMRSAGLRIIDRTFFAGSEGNLRGTIYFGPKGQAIQVAPERGTRRLKWGIVPRVEGVKGPALCVVGGYTDISPARSAVAIQQGRATLSCTPAAVFTRIRNSRGNVLGLGTIIQ